jgi:hypothetical protein
MLVLVYMTISKFTNHLNTKHGLLISYLKTKHTDGASVNNLILVSLKMLSTLSSNEDWLIKWPLRS